MIITATELHKNILEKMNVINPTFKMSELHKAILMECCETAEASPDLETSSIEVLQICTLQSFEVASTLLKSLISGMVNDSNTIVNLNYRDGTYKFDKNSPLLNN